LRRLYQGGARSPLDPPTTQLCSSHEPAVPERGEDVVDAAVRKRERLFLRVADGPLRIDDEHRAPRAPQEPAHAVLRRDLPAGVRKQRKAQRVALGHALVELEGVGGDGTQERAGRDKALALLLV